MSRIAGLANSLRNSGARLGPLDAVFAGADYYTGKLEGEDDVRAIAGAAGSTVGGWGGALAGGQAGATLGMFGGPVGVAVGGAIGAVAGGTLGGIAGGWGADRVDETIRGKKMQYYDRNGNLLGEDDSPEPDGVHNALNFGAGATILGAGGAVTNNLRKNAVNPIANYQVSKGLGLNSIDAAKFAGKTFASDAGQAIAKLPGWGKVLGGAALAYGVDQALGRPVERMVDSITGQRTNFDNDPGNAQKQQQLRQIKQGQNNGYAQQVSDATLQQMNLDPGNRFIKQQADEAYRRQKEDEAFQYGRQKKDYQEESRNKLSAQLGVKLMDNWYNSAQSVNAAMQTIGRASYL